MGEVEVVVDLPTSLGPLLHGLGQPQGFSFKAAGNFGLAGPPPSANETIPDHLRLGERHLKPEADPRCPAGW
jgi:hypothetical protein